MNRQSFIRNSMLASAALLLGTERSAAALSSGKTNASAFRMKFSPDFDIFKELGGKDVIDQIKWGHDNGFRAWENTFLARRPVAEQERISKTVQQLGMEFGQFVGTLTFKDATFASRNKAIRDNVLQDVKASIEIAKRMNTKYIHNVLGMSDPKLPWDFQMANAIELLKQVAALYEPHGLIMVMETMNHRVNHPGMFLHTIPQAYAMAKAVGSPSLKLLFDVYHVQVQEGNLMDTLDYAWDEIAYLQVGDAPGRNEPTTGEINFVNVLQHVYDKGYRGFVGLEHGIKNPHKEGEQKALAAYRSIDPH